MGGSIIVDAAVRLLWRRSPCVLRGRLTDRLPVRQADGVVEHLNIQQQPLKDWNWYEGEPSVSDMEQKLAKGRAQFP